MKSKIRLAGHPVHPMLVGFPIVLYTITTICFVIFRYTEDNFWFRVAYGANLAGIVMAVVAAIPGLADWALAISSNHPAKKVGFMHMSLNMLALLTFSFNAWLESGQWNEVMPEATAAIFLSVVGMLFTLAAGFYGWSLVQKHHVGVDLTPEQNSLEPSNPEAYFSNKNKAG